MSELTKEQAMKKYYTNWWVRKSYKEIADFQLYETRLCMPFDKFHEAVEKVLNRPVFTHEFADYKALQEEYEGKREYQGLVETIERIIPKDKQIIIIETAITPNR
jgi:hypothetical protein